MKSEIISGIHKRVASNIQLNFKETKLLTKLVKSKSTFSGAAGASPRKGESDVISKPVALTGLQKFQDKTPKKHEFLTWDDYGRVDNWDNC